MHEVQPAVRWQTGVGTAFIISNNPAIKAETSELRFAIYFTDQYSNSFDKILQTELLRPVLF